jgi:pSer/pThr/pTyr-binding forkhead associated (FHA) protein
MFGEFDQWQARLICEEQEETRRIDLNRSRLVFGRDPQCNHVFAYQGISRKHFSLERRTDGWQLTDLKSRNGTLINQRRVEQCTLAAGDCITIGGSSRLVPVQWTYHVSSPHPSRLKL